MLANSKRKRIPWIDLNAEDSDDDLPIIPVINEPKRKKQKLSNSNPSFIDKINEIEEKINNMKIEYDQQISKSKSVQCLNQMLLKFKQEINDKMKTFNAQKLEIFTQIDDSYEMSLKSVKNSMEIQQEFMDQTESKISKISEEIQKLQNELKETKETQKSQQIVYFNMNKKKNDLSQKEKENKDKIQEIKENFNKDQSAIIHDFTSKKLKEFELTFKEWNETDFISWIKTIENGKFNDKKYFESMAQIEGLEMNGNTMKDLNASLLKLIRLNSEDAKILLRNVDRVINQNAAPTNNICTFCWTNPINTTFYSCGHQTVCYQCYQDTPKKEFKKCPCCNKKITKVIRNFMSGYEN